ncbi:MAG: DNA cytosine methyltransferase [Alphaproteobacteria bacterium]|nr:DNA cytosine methyltransferase [Alphaproteobacteria bacterium]
MAVRSLNGLGLCAGVGGLELGLHLAEPGYRGVGYVERDARAAAVLVERMVDKALPPAPVFDDLRSFDGRPWRGSVDIISAGYPCQPFSSAGRKRGKDDPRHLWPEVARIIDEVRPGRVVLENVEGHIRLGFREVCADLVGMGFRVAAGLFGAVEAGTPQFRARLFIVADADGFRPRAAVVDRAGASSIQMAEGELTGATLAGRGNRVLGAADDPGAWLEPWRSGAWPDGPARLFPPDPTDLAELERVLLADPSLEPALCGVADGPSSRLDRCELLGNGVFPLGAAYAYCTLDDALAGRRELAQLHLLDSRSL